MSESTIPPKGTANISVRMRPVPHGWDFSVQVKSLERKTANNIPDKMYPYVILWTHVSLLLHDMGADLHTSLSQLLHDQGDDV